MGSKVRYIQPLPRGTNGLPGKAEEEELSVAVTRIFPRKSNTNTLVEMRGGAECRCEFTGR